MSRIAPSAPSAGSARAPRREHDRVAAGSDHRILRPDPQGSPGPVADPPSRAAAGQCPSCLCNREHAQELDGFELHEWRAGCCPSRLERRPRCLLRVEREHVQRATRPVAEPHSRHEARCLTDARCNAGRHECCTRLDLLSVSRFADDHGEHVDPRFPGPAPAIIECRWPN